MKKKLIFIAFLLALLSSPLALSARAQDVQSTINGLNQSANQVDAFKTQTNSTVTYNAGFLSTKVGQIIGIVLSLVGVIFLLLMIYAGLTWMLARGNEQEVSKAKELLINAIIGIVIVFAAYAITSFLGNAILAQ